MAARMHRVNGAGLGVAKGMGVGPGPSYGYHYGYGYDIEHANDGIGGVGLLPAATLANIGISAGIGLAMEGIQLWVASARLRGSQKIGATNRANEAEYYMKNNLEAWQNSAKTKADQQTALAAFDLAWGKIIGATGCGDPAMGSAGQRCIDERGPGRDVKYPWFAWYRDPIADDPEVAGGESIVAGLVDAALPNLTQLGLTPGVIIAGGVALLALAFLD